MTDEAFPMTGDAPIVYVREADREMVEEYYNWILKIAEGAALATRTEYKVTLITGGKRLSGDAAVQLEICHRQGIVIEELGEKSSVQEVIGAAGGLDMAVDALFGTGLTRPLDGVFAEAIAAFNLLHIPRIAVDLPSASVAIQISGTWAVARKRHSDWRTRSARNSSR